MSTSNRAFILAVLLFTTLGMLAAHSAQAQQKFPLQDGDTWVLAGDSITAQHLHSNYFEAYCFTRFPQWTLHFRNSGVGGDTIPRVLARFDWDVAAWKPTVVSVELGMNDSGTGAGGAAGFIERMETLSNRIRAIQARPIFFSSSPVNDGTTSDKLAGRNQTLDKFATAEAAFAEKEKAPYADQFHALLDLWGHNHFALDTAHSAGEVQKLAARADIPRGDLLKSWLEEWNRSGKAGQNGVNLMGDAVHPGPPGQLTMCAALLQALHAPGLVSSATIEASGKLTATEECKITDLKTENGGVSFTRLDQCLPMPIPNDARSALEVMPAISELNRWMLTVKSLSAGEYELRIDGVPVAKFPAEVLAKGCNLGTLEKGPVAQQGQQVLALIEAKEALVGQFRAKSASVASAPADQARAVLDPIAQQVLEADAKIRTAAQPQARQFTITPLK